MSPRIDVATARARLADGRLAPVYLLTGDDDVEKRGFVAAVVDSIDEGLRAFNVERFYGTDATLRRVLDAARTLPFGDGRRVVIVLQAEKLLQPTRVSEETRRDLEALAEYLAQPVPQTVLVLSVRSLDGRKSLSKVLRAAAVEIECAGLAGLGDVGRWIRQTLAASDLQADRSAVQLIVERAGNDVARLRAQVARVQLYCSDQQRVSRQDVLAVVASPIASDEWAVTRAIERGSAGEALTALALGLDSGAAPFMILGQLAWFVRTKYPPGKVADVIDAVFETDLALKSSVGDPRVLLERLIVRLCEGAVG